MKSEMAYTEIRYSKRHRVETLLNVVICQRLKYSEFCVATNDFYH